MCPKVKICGITREGDATAAADAGADLIGLNLWPGTPRFVSVAHARRIADAVRGRIEIVAVFVDASRDEILYAIDQIGAQAVQLHGSETPQLAASLGDIRVIKAVRVAQQKDLRQLEDFPAFAFVLDAKVQGFRGGTGQTFDWGLARTAARQNRILLAGGLTPENVAEAVRVVRPWGVDTASGVETSPGVKDHRKLELFVANAKLCNEANT